MTGQPDVEPLRAEQVQEPPDGLRAPDWQNGDPLGMKVAATALSQRLERALVADPLDQHDRARDAAVGQCASCRDECGTGVFRLRSRLLVHVTNPRRPD